LKNKTKKNQTTKKVSVMTHTVSERVNDEVAKRMVFAWSEMSVWPLLSFHQKPQQVRSQFFKPTTTQQQTKTKNNNDKQNRSKEKKNTKLRE
jgi:hypothetical protein